MMTLMEYLKKYGKDKGCEQFVQDCIACEKSNITPKGGAVHPNGDRLKALLESFKMTSVRLAQLTELNHATIKKAINGDPIRFSSVSKMAKVLQVTPYKLIKEDSE